MSTTRTDVNTWGGAASVFAASMMIVVGAFQFFEGLVAVANGNDFLVRTPNYVFQFDATAWGWIHMLPGIVVALAGAFIFTGNPAARAVGILVAIVSLISNFAWLPYYPLWALVIIAIDVFVIWGLCSVRLNNEV
jgi:hypothetical protein